MEEAESAEVVAADPAATSESASAVAGARGKDGSATTATVLRNGSRVPRAAAGPRDGVGKESGGRLGSEGAGGAASREREAAAPSEEEAYVAAVKGLLFGTMRMETSSAGAGGGSREFFLTFFFVFRFSFFVFNFTFLQP